MQYSAILKALYWVWVDGNKNNSNIYTQEANSLVYMKRRIWFFGFFFKYLLYTWGFDM